MLLVNIRMVVVTQLHPPSTHANSSRDLRGDIRTKVFFTYSSSEIHLGSFPVSAVVNYAAISMMVQVSLW